MRMFQVHTLALLLSFTSIVFAIPRPSSTAGQSIALRRRSTAHRTEEEWALWAKNQREVLITKYGVAKPQRRSSGTNLITNQNADSSFFGSIAIGTPPMPFNVILDTGSADLWIADSSCSSGCSDTSTTFDRAASTSFTNSSTQFSIQYGSGQASGTLGQDVVQMAGFAIPNQIFGLCDKVSSGLLQNPVSGLLGLGFSTISQSGATPFWQTLAASNAWDSPVMAFHLTRFVDDPQARSEEAGGSFTMGFLDQTLYTGVIEFTNIPSGQESYWILPMKSITVQGNTIDLPNNSGSYAAIDTGTTLVGGPSNAIAAIYADIPGSVAQSGDYSGYYTYPCDAAVNITLSFGGSNWPISNADFKLKQTTGGQCLGALFALDTGSGAPSWIVGDTFLKNVFSVFRFSPPSVGFAQLSDNALAQNDVQGTVPTPTLADSAVTVVATENANRAIDAGSSGAAPFAGMVGIMLTTVIAWILLDIL